MTALLRDLRNALPQGALLTIAARAVPTPEQHLELAQVGQRGACGTVCTHRSIKRDRAVLPVPDAESWCSGPQATPAG